MDNTTGIFDVDPILDDYALSEVETEGQRLCHLCRTLFLAYAASLFIIVTMMTSLNPLNTVTHASCLQAL
jgi:hypothetical protein